MTIELMEPREGRISFPQPELVPLKSDIVLNDGQEIRATLSETYYIFVEFPTTHILYQEPDTDGEVSLEDLRAISKRHIVNEEVVDPEPGWPEGWK